VKPVTLAGVALIMLGVLALASQGITCTTHEKVWAHRGPRVLARLEVGFKTPAEVRSRWERC
jgi:hypothetical protein